MYKGSFRFLVTVGLLAMLIVSEVPFVLTFAKTGWSPLPPVVDYPADQMLYLNFTVIQHSSPAEVVNPWYGDRVPIAAVPHLQFPITFQLFNVLRLAIHSWTGAMLIWTAVWSLLTFVAAVFCLRSIAPELDAAYAVLFAFAWLVLRSPLTYVSAFASLPSYRGFLDLTLPYERFAFPQVALPAFLAYWGFLAKALRKPRWRTLVWMVLLQFAACITFPYIVPLMALGTLLAILIAAFRSNEQSLSLFQVVGFAASCIAIDGLYLLFSGTRHSHGNVELSLGLHPQYILPSFRPYVFLLFSVAIVAMLSRISFAGKAVAAGAAIASGLLGFANVVFPQESLMLIHFNYVNALAIWLALFVFAWPLLAGRSRRWLPLTAAVLAALAVAEGYANYVKSLEFNQLQRAAVAEVQQLHLTSADTVLAPANLSDDISCWIPLISPAKVAFTRDAENVLPRDRIYGEQAVRQAFYLQVTGNSYESLSALTQPGSTRPIPGSFVLFGEESYLWSPLEADRVRGRSLVRQRLLPAMASLSNPNTANSIFFGAKRIVVIDDDRKPNFVRSALTNWIDIASEKHENGISVMVGTPRAERIPEAANSVGRAEDSTRDQSPAFPATH